MAMNNLTAEHIIDVISSCDTSDKYRRHRTALLAGYFEGITKLNPDEVIKATEVAILLRWTLSKS
jgi:hypothetical protein